LNFDWLKAHWYYAVGGLIGVYVIYQIFASASGSSGGSSDASTSNSQLESYQAAADLQDAQVNGQVEVASYAANVQNNQTAAALQLGEVQTAAELSATQSETNAAVEANQADVTGTVEANQAVVNGQVAETNIEGQTIDTLGSQKEAVSLATINGINQQIANVQEYSKNAGEDYGKLAPLIEAETGQAGAAAATAAAIKGNQSTIAQNISAGGGAASSILSGLLSY
jgi:hypothetical protein